MRVKNKYEYKYLALNLKASVVKRFRIFAKKIASSQSEALGLMLDFFEWHGISPSDRFTESLVQEILKNRQRTETSIKRTEATIAIIRDIEINQTKPNNAMLLSLFGGSIKDEEPARKEKKLIEKKSRQSGDIEITVPKIQYDKLTDKMNRVTHDFDYVLGKVKRVKNNFGKDYLRLDISQKELENFIQNLRNL